jgi:uncharacterized membrane protein
VPKASGKSSSKKSKAKVQASSSGDSPPANDDEFDPMDVLLDEKGPKAPPKPIRPRATNKPERKTREVDDAETESDAPSPETTRAESAAGSAGNLLIQSGKKNQTANDEFDPEAEERAARRAEAMKYLFGHYLPIVAGILGLTVGVYFFASWMILSPPEFPPLGTVSGSVLFDGKPLVGASVIFIPIRPVNDNADIKPASSDGKTDEQGQFTLNYTGGVRGAAIGKHRVEIQKTDEKIGIPTIHIKYNGRTELRADVKAGHNKIEPFKLKNGP